MSGHDNWPTPKALYDDLNSKYHFNDDPCPLYGALTTNDGLNRDWGTSTFMNPPYSYPKPWVEKAYRESLKGKLVVGLLRGDTSTQWFHEWVLGKANLIFIKGRLRFNNIGPAPFASIVAIWDGR